MSVIPITKEQAADLLEIASAVVVDDLGVCFHNVYREEADVGDTWFEARFEDPDGQEFEFLVDTTEGITWDGVQVSIPHEGEELPLVPLIKTADTVLWQEFISRIEARTVTGEKIRVELRPGTHKLQRMSPSKVEEGSVVVGVNVPAGVEVSFTRSGKYTFADFTYPEVAPKLFKHAYSEPVVAEIMGRRWKINVDTDRRGGRAEVIFETTDEPLTKADLASRGDVSHWFGQPKFIQNEVLPHLNGKSAYLLQVRETGWGDSGNENVFVTFDEQGIPNGVYVEASCC